MRRFQLFVILSVLSFNLFSQNKIRENDILFKQSLTRSIPLTYGENKKLFGDANYLVRVLLDAYSNGEIEGYENIELTKKVHYCERINLLNPELISEESDEISASIFKQVELTEDIVFDSKYSEVVLNPIGITIIVSPEFNKYELLQPFVTFKFSDCTKIFKKDSRAVAINPQLNGRNVNFNEVFLMHLYTSYISKIGSPTDSYFDQLKSDKMEAFLYGKSKEEELQNYLYKLLNPR